MNTIIYGTTRKDSNTRLLGDRLFSNKEHDIIDLKDYNILSIVDERHSEKGFVNRGDDYYQLEKKILESDTLTFVTPLYWYGMSDLLKKFISRFSESMRDKDLDFKEKMHSKKAYVIIVGGDNPKIKALPLIQQFSYIFDFLEMDFVDYVIGEGNEPFDVLEDKAAVEKIDALNKHFQ